MRALGVPSARPPSAENPAVRYGGHFIISTRSISQGFQPFSDSYAAGRWAGSAPMATCRKDWRPGVAGASSNSTVFFQ